MKRIPMIALAGCVLAAPIAAEADASHLCAGISEEGRAEAEAYPHNLKLVYAEPSGAYLGEVDTTISANGKTIASAYCEGPWLMMNLPAGAYKVTAKYMGQSKTVSVSVGKSGEVKKVITFKDAG